MLSRKDIDAVLIKLKSSLKILLVAVIIGGLGLGLSIYSEKYRVDANKIITNRGLITNNQTEIKSIENQISSNSQLAGNLLTEDSFVKFLGESTAKNDLKLTRFKAGTPKMIGTLNQVNYAMEVKGSPAALDLFINDLNDLKIGYKVNAISYRKDGDVLWNRRSVESEQILNWVEFEESPYKEKLAVPNIGIKDLMSNSDYYIYLDLDFITKVSK